MKIKLIRDTFHPDDTLGKLYINGLQECFTCEDTVREVAGRPVETWKIKGATAIPRGVYPVSMTVSARFGKIMPLLGDVPGFAGIRIHSGNTSADTEGCILVGSARLPFGVGMSKVATMALYAKIQKALDNHEEITIEVV